LGTLEPRKNAGIVFDFLLQDPSVLTRYTFVFVGRDGWLDERWRLEQRIAKLGIPADRIVFTGYVSDEVKLALLNSAEFTIFPSLFEGFGLPALESISVGCPVLCSFASSLPEVVDSTCVLFDPTDLISFSSGFTLMEERNSDHRRSGLVDPLDIAAPEHLSWSRFTNPICEWLRELD
jgi:glycosyltransferase involved in cell wall biosynthesis